MDSGASVNETVKQFSSSTTLEVDENQPDSLKALDVVAILTNTPM